MPGDSDGLIPYVNRRQRFKGLLLNVLTALSLLLCAAMASLWVRSYFVSDALFRQFFTKPDDTIAWTREVVHVGRGGIGFARVVQTVDWYPNDAYGEAIRQRVFPLVAPHRAASPTYPSFDVSPREPTLGFRLDWYRFKRGNKLVGLFQWIVPLWCPFLLFLAEPARRAWRWRRERTLRSRAGLCAVCGYDLRATPGQCPECGAPGLDACPTTGTGPAVVGQFSLHFRPTTLHKPRRAMKAGPFPAGL
jgi:hypothetical protein